MYTNDTQTFDILYRSYDVETAKVIAYQCALDTCLQIRYTQSWNTRDLLNYHIK